MCKVLHSNYSESNTAQRKSIMNDLITKMNLSKTCKVFRVINNIFSIIMSEKEIRQSIRIQFKAQVNYKNINNLKPAF